MSKLEYIKSPEIRNGFPATITARYEWPTSKVRVYAQERECRLRQIISTIDVYTCDACGEAFFHSPANPGAVGYCPCCGAKVVEK